MSQKRGDDAFWYLAIGIGALVITLEFALWYGGKKGWPYVPAPQTTRSVLD